MLNNSTITDIIDAGRSKNISHGNLHFKAGYKGNDNIRRVYNMTSVIDMYRDILLKNMVPVELTDKEREYYRFKPRSYCQDLYNDKELWSTLLRLNNMVTSVDFNRRRFLSFGPNFVKILNEILTIEDDGLMASEIEAKTR